MIDENIHVTFEGLKNFQNNCYMNAIIQCLRVCRMDGLQLKDSADWFKHMIALITKNKADSNDLSAFINDFFESKNHRQGHESHNFVRSMQADAREFLMYVLENIEKKTVINFAEAFNIKIIETIEKSCNKHTITKVSDENMLNLKINSQSTQKMININELLKDYFKKEEIDCECESCKTTKAKKNSILKATPQNLIVVLNTFKFENNVSKKIHTFIELTNEINLGSYYECSREKCIQEFRLFGVCYHLGNDINSGHYTSKF